MTTHTAEPTTRELEEIVTAFRAEAFINGNLDAIETCLVQDFVDHFAPPWDPPGRAGVRQRFGQAAAAFHTTQVEIVHSMSRGNVLMQAIRIHMTHTGEFMGLPPTGRHIVIGGFDAFEIQDGKLAAHWGSYDVSRIPDLLGHQAGGGGDAGEAGAGPSWSEMWER